MEPAFVPRAMVGVTPAAPPDVAACVRRHTHDGVYENGGDAGWRRWSRRETTTEVNLAKEVVEEAPTTTSLNDEAGDGNVNAVAATRRSSISGRRP